MKRCEWCGSDPLYIEYHDKEWGVPVHEDQKLFEMICLEGAQAGLSWITILKKREHYQKLFFDFDIQKCANLTDEYLESCLLDAGIIRNKLKVYGVRKNALACMKVQEEFGSLDAYVWSFVENQPIINTWKEMSEIPVSTEISDRFAKDLKKRGFTFVGTTIVYAYMQAVGMVNDHTVDCFCFSEK